LGSLQLPLDKGPVKPVEWTNFRHRARRAGAGSFRPYARRTGSSEKPIRYDDNLMDLRFRVALALLVVALIAVRMPRQLAAKKGTSDERRVEGTLNVVLRSIAGLVGFMLLAVYLIMPQWLGRTGLGLPDVLRWFGVVVGVSGLGGLIWIHRELGRNFSGTLRTSADQSLVTSGPYHWVRHPMYTAFFLIVFSFFLISANWLLGAVWIGALSVVVASRMPKEDTAMEARFGDHYRLWAQSTGRFLPRLR